MPLLSTQEWGGFLSSGSGGMSCCASPIPTAQGGFSEGSGRMGRLGCVAGTSRCVPSQSLSVNRAGKNMWSLGFQWETSTENPFHFLQLESDARSCCFRVWISVGGGLGCTSECASGECAQGKCRAQKVGLAAGCHFSADQVCCGNLCVSLKKTNKATKTNTRASACV